MHLATHFRLLGRSAVLRDPRQRIAGVGLILDRIGAALLVFRATPFAGQREVGLRQILALFVGQPAAVRAVRSAQ